MDNIAATEAEVTEIATRPEFGRRAAREGVAAKRSYGSDGARLPARAHADARSLAHGQARAAVRGRQSAERSARRLRHSSGDRGLHQFDDFLLYRGAPLLHRERHGPQVPVVEGRSVLDSSVEYRVLNLPEFLKLTTTLPSALA